MKFVLNVLLVLFSFSVCAQTEKPRIIVDSTMEYQQLEEVGLIDKKMDPYNLLSIWIEKNLEYNTDKDTIIPYSITYVVSDMESKDTLAIAEGTFVIDHKSDTKILDRNLLKNSSAYTSLKYTEIDNNTNYFANYLKEKGIGSLMCNNFLSRDYKSTIRYKLRKSDDRILEMKKDVSAQQFIFDYHGIDGNDIGTVKFYFNHNKLLDSVESVNRHVRYITEKEKFMRTIYSRELLSYDVQSNLLYPTFIDYLFIYSADDKSKKYKVRVVAQRMDVADGDMMNSDLYKKRISILMPIKKAYEMSKRRSYNE